jgi:predicted Zn-dependent protease
MSALAEQLQAALTRYDTDDNLGRLLDAVRALAKESDPDRLVAAADRFKDRPEIVIPVYEHVVAERPSDARALVALANAYWLTGRGPEVVGELAVRAKEADPDNRAGWHLWALAESDVRKRMERWRAVAERFPADQLARAALADNAASVASAEHDPLALDLAITTYEGLLNEASAPTQKRALETTLETLRGWKL